MLSLGMDLEGVVNDSYGFLSDMDSGTVPRRRPVPVQIQSWNERSDSKSRRNITDWEKQYQEPAEPRQTRKVVENTSRSRQQEPVSSYPPERNDNTSSPSTLWKRTNEMPLKNYQCSEPHYEAPQRQNSQQSYYGTNGAQHQRSVQQQPREEEFRINSHEKMPRSPRQYSEQQYYNDVASDRGRGGYTGGRSGGRDDRGQTEWRGSVDDIIRDVRRPYPLERQSRMSSSDSGWESQNYGERNIRLGGRQESYRSSGNMRDPGPIYAESNVRQGKEYRRDAGRSAVYANPSVYIEEDNTRHEEKKSSTKGSFLLQRTNTYLDAIDNLQARRSDHPESVTRFNGSIPVEPPKVPERANFPDFKRLGSTNSVNQKMTENRMSMDARDLNRSSVAPPPAPPMPPAMPTTILPAAIPPRDIDTTVVSASKQVPAKLPTPPWLEDLKKGRRELRRVPSLKRTELEPEPEPKTFKDKLERIVLRQVTEQRWHMAKPSPKRVAEEENAEEVVAGTEPYKTVKTLNKYAMKNKLEKILVKGPPNRPSFHGAFDMDDSRKDAVARLRAIEKDALEKQRAAEEEEDEFPPTNALVKPSVVLKRSPSVVNSEGPVETRQRMLMGNVMATIKLKGAKSGTSSS